MGDYTLWWIIGFAVLVFATITALVLSGKADAAIEFFQNFMRFGK